MGQKPRIIDVNDLIRQSEAARLLGVSKQAVNDRIKNKTIEVEEIAGIKFVLRSDLWLPKKAPKFMDVSDFIQQCQASRLRGVTIGSTHTMVRLGRIPIVEIAGFKFVRRSDVEAFTYKPCGRSPLSWVRHPRSRTLDYIREVFQVSQDEFEQMLEDVEEPARTVLRSRSGFEPFKTHEWLADHLGFNCPGSVRFCECRALERLRERLPKKRLKGAKAEATKYMIRQVRKFVGLADK